MRGPWAPSTQATASTTLDLPLPLGPTTTVTPGSNSSTAGSAKDLKPLRESDFRNTGRSPYRHPTGAAEPAHTWQCSQKNVERPPDLTRTMVAGTAGTPALAVVGLVLVLVVADLPEQVPVLLVRQRGAPALDRLGQRLDHGAVEPTHLLGRQRIRRRS